MKFPNILVGQRSGGWRIPLAIGAMIALLSVIAWQALGPLSSVRELFVASSSVPVHPEAKINSELESKKPDNTPKPTSDGAERTVPKPDIETTVDETTVSAPAIASEGAPKGGESLGSKAPTTKEPKLADVASPDTQNLVGGCKQSYIPLDPKFRGC